MALPIVGNTKGLLLLSLFLLSIVDLSLAESNESLYGLRANRVLKSGKSMKKKSPSKSEKKHKKSKKHHSPPSKTDGPATEDPTGAPTGGAPEPPVVGCYMSESVREAGYANGACDCEMTEEACLAEPKEDGFPIWTNGCQGICLCPSSGWGCYHFSEHECDCSTEACEGEEEACEALGQGHFWTSGCTSCQCPNKINTPTCKIDPKPDPNPGPGPTPTGSGCYRMLTHDCECTEEVCSEEQCTDDGGIWVENECTSCQCPGT